MLPIAHTVFCWEPVLFTFYTFAFALQELHIISFLAVVKPVVIFTAGTHRRRRPLSVFFAHLAAAVAPTLPVVQAHGLHATTIAINTRGKTIRGVTTCTHDSNDLFMRLVRLLLIYLLLGAESFLRS